MARGKKPSIKTPQKKQSQVKRVVTTTEFDQMLLKAANYGELMFGTATANKFLLDIRKRIGTLSTQYQFYPACRFIPTKTSIYRNIIFKTNGYLVLYRIKPQTVEVLAIYHSSIKPTSIKKMRSIKP